MADSGKKVPPHLHELESEVMEEVWRRGEATVRDVLGALNRGARERAYTTIMTIMVRLTRKGMLRRRKRGRTHIYEPTMDREVYLRSRAGGEVDGLVEDYGDIALAHFARQLQSLDPERRDQLRKLAEDS